VSKLAFIHGDRKQSIFLC